MSRSSKAADTFRGAEPKALHPQNNFFFAATEIFGYHRLSLGLPPSPTIQIRVVRWAAKHHAEVDPQGS